MNSQGKHGKSLIPSTDLPAALLMRPLYYLRPTSKYIEWVHFLYIDSFKWRCWIHNMDFHCLHIIYNHPSNRYKFWRRFTKNSWTHNTKVKHIKRKTRISTKTENWRGRFDMHTKEDIVAFITYSIYNRWWRGYDLFVILSVVPFSLRLRCLYFSFVIFKKKKEFILLVAVVIELHFILFL